MLGIDNNTLFIERPEDIPGVIAAFDVAVQPSLSEGFSNVLVEYMAAGKPVVATRVGDAQRVIESENYGLLVEPDNPMDLSEAILSICSNLQNAERMGLLAREKVKQKWSEEKILNEYMRFYLTAAGRRSANF
jgi:glycosyltransferase involved in cell wall biosynthesis